MRLEPLQITTLTTEGNSHVETLDITNHIENKLREDQSFFIPGTNTIFLNKKDIVDDLLETHVVFESVELDRKGLQGLAVLIQERESTHSLCIETTCFTLDPNGLLFKAIDAPQDLGIVFESENDYAIGDAFLDSQQLTELSVLKESLELKGLVVTKIIEQSEFTLTLLTSQGTRILIPKGNSYDDLYSILIKLMNTQDFLLDTETQDFKQDYAYINLQFGKKVFSCLQGEECEGNYK